VLHTPDVRVVVTGASGLIGSALVPALEKAGHDVVRLVRRTPASPVEIEWNPATAAIDASALVGVEAAVNLNGATIGRRWTASRRKEILASRIESTRVLSTALASLDPRPSVLVCAGGVGIYGYDRGDEILTEKSPLGTGFLAEVGSAWEAAADPARESGIRVVNFRQGLVLSGDGGVLGELLPFFKLGLGGRVGNGRQWWPWIAMDDLVAGYLSVLDAPTAGPVNLTSPSPATNTQFTKALGNALRRPTIVPVPAIGAKLVFGEMAEEALLGGQRALPSRLLAEGFSFRFPELSEALSHVLAR
jgi:uncharacterized protein (TIGR01777 family)